MMPEPFDVLVDMASRDRTWDQPVDLEVDATAAAILQRVFADAVAVPVPLFRRRRRLVAVAVVISVLAAGSAVAATSLWTRSAPSTVRALACWNEAPLGANGVILGTRFGEDDPVDTCKRLWAQPANEEYGVTGDLVTCVADYGTAVVIPGADETACDIAGLDRFDGRIAPDLLAIRDVEDEMADLQAAGACMDDDTARSTVREALDRHGLSEWTITAHDDPTLAEPTCSTFSFDEATATAMVIAIEAEPS